MPISSDEWKEGRTQETTETRILNFLGSNKDKAFTIYEIIEYINPSSLVDPTESWTQIGVTIIADVMKSWSITQAVERLMEEGKISAKEIETPEGAETYYKAV